MCWNLSTCKSTAGVQKWSCQSPKSKSRTGAVRAELALNYQQVKHWLWFQKNSHLCRGESLTFPCWLFWKWFLKALREEEHFVNTKITLFFYNGVDKTQNRVHIPKRLQHFGEKKPLQADVPPERSTLHPEGFKFLQCIIKTPILISSAVFLLLSQSSEVLARAGWRIAWNCNLHWEWKVLFFNFSIEFDLDLN